MNEDIQRTEGAESLPPPPIDTTLPVPEPAFLKLARANKSTFQGLRMVRHIDCSPSYAYAFWGVFALIMGGFWALSLVGESDAIPQWFVIAWFALTVALFARSVYLWYRGDVFHFVLNREGCEPGTAIASLFLRGELLYHEQISWRDVKVVEMRSETRSQLDAGYFLCRPYAFPASTRPKFTRPSRASTGMALGGGGAPFLPTAYMLDIFQHAAGRPDGFGVRETILAALHPDAAFYTPQWFERSIYPRYKDEVWSAETALAYEQVRLLDLDGNPLPQPTHPYMVQ